MIRFSTTSVRLCAIASVFIATAAHAVEGDFLWADAFGGASSEMGRSIAVDGSGNVYTTGHFFGTADFDPGAGTSTLVSAGGQDVFITKFDSAGVFQWARGIGGTGTEIGFSICVDNNANVYVAGCFDNTVDFDPGAATSNLISGGSADAFVLKLDTGGNFVWATPFSGASAQIGRAIAVDINGNAYSSGSFNGNAGSLTNAGNTDTFIIKLDISGALVWERALSGASDEVAVGIAVDGAGNVHTTGYFYGTVDFEPGIVTNTLSSAGSADIFVSKLDNSGNFIWAKQMGGTSFDSGNAITVDTSSNVYVTGYFQDSYGSLILVGSTDLFITKLNNTGALVWERSKGNTIDDYGNGIAVNSGGDVYVAGSFQGNVDGLTSVGFDDAFICKLDNLGTTQMSKSFGGPFSDFAQALALGVNGALHTTGVFSGTTDFDPGTGVANLSSVSGTQDVFVSKLEGVAVDITPPSFSNLAVDINPAQDGNTVTITFDASESLQANPTVTVNGNPASFVGATGVSYTYTYAVTAADPIDFATIEIDGLDTAGNPGLLTDSSTLEIISSPTGVPLAAWPSILTFAAGGALTLRRRNRK